ncbi:MAG: glycoside hydrolase family 97 N-terminal domain-containing protein, partial [Eudoraea sp.]|nr:glycoside hydrolase family 97 N-terminal domain-containing protein [Eudoraea sp.]
MKRILAIAITGALFLTASCKQEKMVTSITSPSGTNSVAFNLASDGTPYYLVKHQNATVIDTSSLGFEFKEQPALKNGLKIVATSQNTLNETWEMPWGEQLQVENHYNELVVELEETTEPNRKITIYFRAYDDGVAFRYEFPEQATWSEALITEEHTQFNLTGDHTTWWIPGDWDIYEHLYSTTKFTEINALEKAHHENLASTYIPENAVNTPVSMRTEDGLHLSFHEASLVDYSGMT